MSLIADALRAIALRLDPHAIDRARLAALGAPDTVSDLYENACRRHRLPVRLDYLADTYASGTPDPAQHALAQTIEGTPMHPSQLSLDAAAQILYGTEGDDQ